MSDERRYDEQEVAEIFQAAAAGPGPVPDARSSATGLTLHELQAIGAEVGLEPARVAEAALTLDVRRNAVLRTDFGMPVSVGRTIDLHRPPTDREWAMLVGDLRETFGARGREASHGTTREWTNGNLHAYVEPTDAGYRLRLGTTKGDAETVNRLGLAGLLMTLVLVVVLMATGRLEEKMMALVVIALMSAGGLAFNALRLPAWSREREAQMERIAARAAALLGAASPAPLLPGGPDE